MDMENRLCSCESGKIYKNCCMDIENSIYAFRGEVIESLLEYGLESYNGDFISFGWNDFLFTDSKEMDSDMNSPINFLFVPWLFFHWPGLNFKKKKETSYPSRFTIASAYLNQKKGKLDDKVVQYVTNSTEEPVCFWEIQKVNGSSGMTLKDIYTGEVLFVRDSVFSDETRVGEILLGQVVSIDGIYILNAALPPLDKQFNPMIKKAVATLDINQKGEKQRSDLLRFDEPLLQIYADHFDLLDDLEPPLDINLEEKLQIVSVFDFKPDSWFDIVKKLEKNKEIQPIDFDKVCNERYFVWMPESEVKKDDNYVGSGLISVEQSVLYAETADIQEDGKLRELLKESLGSLIEYMVTTDE